MLFAQTILFHWLTTSRQFFFLYPSGKEYNYVAHCKWLVFFNGPWCVKLGPIIFSTGIFLWPTQTVRMMDIPKDFNGFFHDLLSEGKRGHWNNGPSFLWSFPGLPQTSAFPEMIDLKPLFMIDWMRPWG